jgi:hypothetical protein
MALNGCLEKNAEVGYNKVYIWKIRKISRLILKVCYTSKVEVNGKVVPVLN